MTNDSNDELSPDERALLNALPREVAPPPELEERVVRELASRGVLHRRRPSGGPLRFAAPLGALAAVVLVFVAGVAIGRTRPAAPVEDPRPQFVLLLQEGKGFDRSPGATRERVAEYTAWARQLGQRGLIVSGEKLKEEGLLLSPGAAGVAVEREAVVDSDGATRGYFVIRARDQGEALSIARSCPHLKHGGRVSLRPIEKT